MLLYDYDKVSIAEGTILYMLKSILQSKLEYISLIYYVIEADSNLTTPTRSVPTRYAPTRSSKVSSKVPSLVSSAGFLLLSTSLSLSSKSSTKIYSSKKLTGSISKRDGASKSGSITSNDSIIKLFRNNFKNAQGQNITIILPCTKNA